MEYTELDDYPIPAGAVTTWTPTAPDTAWQDDPRGLSYDHAAHLAREPGGSWIGSAMRMPARYESEALRRTLRAWTARHEVLRTTVRPTREWWDRVTAGAEQVDVRPVELGHQSADQVRETLAAFMATLSPVAWPHCVFATVTSPGDSGFILVLGADHSVMDAYSQLLWFAEMAELYQRALDGADEAELWLLDVGSHVDFSASDRELGEVIGPDDPAVGRWRDFLSRGAHGEPLGVPAFPAIPDAAVTDAVVSTDTQRSLSTWVLQDAEADVLSARSRELGTGLQSVGLAALALAARRRTGAERLRFVMPMHTRHDPRHVGAVGWYVGLCPVDLDISGAGSFPDVVARAHTAVAASKDLARKPFPRLVELLGLDEAPRFVISYVDMRRVPGAAHWSSWQARALRGPVHAPDEVYLWILRSHIGVSVSARYPATARADSAMRGLVANLRAVLSEMVLDASAVVAEVG